MPQAAKRFPVNNQTIAFFLFFAWPVFTLLKLIALAFLLPTFSFLLLLLFFFFLTNMLNPITSV